MATQKLKQGKKYWHMIAKFAMFSPPEFCNLQYNIFLTEHLHGSKIL